MTTKTDYHSIVELREQYTPAQRGIANVAEITMIREMLEISTRNDIELQNIRDTAVMLYSQWAEGKRDNDIPAAMTLMDAMSAICGVIDAEKLDRGLPV